MPSPKLTVVVPLAMLATSVAQAQSSGSAYARRMLDRAETEFAKGAVGREAAVAAMGRAGFCINATVLGNRTNEELLAVVKKAQAEVDNGRSGAAVVREVLRCSSPEPGPVRKLFDTQSCLMIGNK